MAVQNLRQRWQGLSRLQRWSIIAGGSLLLYTVFGFWLLPAIVRAQLEKKLSQALHRPTTVQKVQFNPYTLEAAVTGFQVLEPSGGEPFVSFERLHVTLQAASLFKRAIIIRSFSLLNPYARIVLNSDKTFNFSDLAAGDGEEKPLLFSVNNIELLGGGIDFTDRLKEAEHHVTDLHIGLPFLSNLPYEVEIFTQPVFEAVINGTSFSMLGESKPFHMTRESEIDLDFHDIDLTGYLVYLPDNLNFTIKNGRLDLDLSLSFIQHEDGSPAVNIRGKTSLREMQMVDGLEQPLLSFPELTVDIARAHLLRREFHLARIFWRKPELFVERGEDGQFNLARLVSFPADEQQSTAPAPPADGLLFEVADATLEEAVIHFTDRTVSGPMQSTLRPVNLQIRDFSTAPETSAAYNLALTSESNEKIGVSGTFTLAPLQVAADATVDNLRPGKYRPYYEHALRAQPEAETVRAAAHIDYAGNNGGLLISGLGIDLEGFSITGPDGADTIAIPAFSINGAEVNIRNQTVTVDRCASRGAVIPVTRRGDGTINLRDFLATAPAGPGMPEEAPEDDDAHQPAWQATVKALDFADFQVTFTDRTTEEPVVLSADQLRLTADNVTTREGEQTAIDLGLRLNGSGSVKAAGSVVLSPLALQLEADLADLPLKSVQPYVERKLNIILTDGLAEIKGSPSLDRRSDDGIGFSFQGDAGVSNFAALDGVAAEKLLSWDAVRVTELAIQTLPTRVTAGELLLDGVAASLSRSPEGVLNLATVVRQDAGEEEEEEKPAGEEPPPEIEIARVRLADCFFDFVDRSVAPRFNTSLEKITGDIKGLSSARDASAEINVTAMLDQHSPVGFTGSIHPWQELFTDVTAEFSNIELTPMSPYTIKFIGYPLTRGKLSLNLHYLIEGARLTSQNRAFIDQITLGDFVQNETAVNLPVQLAISLLKNRRGEIELNIPVSGRLDDPQFSVAGVVFKMITNLIVKAATSPFSLLGAVFAGDGKEQYIEFEAGRAEINPEAGDMLTEFAKVLYDRPAIKVDLLGRVDPARDNETLLQMRFDRLLKAQKLKDTARESTLSNVDDVEIGADEYEHYLKKAYKAADFERPRNFLGMLKDIPAEEMEQLLRDHLVISGDDLQRLAVQRAGVVRNVLMEQGPVEADRIFIVEPRGGYGEGREQPAMRVEISVR
ncbi:MAG TPA: DUF748 domain-containing protein [Desulfobacteraceae bacterium]|nr:DUF748 domain-containing protein [Desulfobacteraceae bacterium]